MSGLIVLFRTSPEKRIVLKKADYTIWHTLLSVSVHRDGLSQLFQLGGFNKLSVVPRKVLKNRFEAFRHIGSGFVVPDTDYPGLGPCSGTAESIRPWIRKNLDDSDNWAIQYFSPELVAKYQLVQKATK